MQQLAIGEENEQGRGQDFSYLYYIAPWPAPSDSERKTFGRLIGKKAIAGTEGYQPSHYWHEDRKYEAFTIGVDANDDQISSTCDDDQLANNFGKNPDAPHYLTPVFFRKEVLGKYYADAAKYRVEDGHVFCSALWSLRIDNNHPDYVVVFLGDLGHLSNKEQLYWRSYNVVPDGGISEVAFRRGILGEWADPDEPALAFKLAYSQFREGMAAGVRLGPLQAAHV